jgi:hypothetical protein
MTNLLLGLNEVDERWCHPPNFDRALLGHTLVFSRLVRVPESKAEGSFVAPRTSFVNRLSCDSGVVSYSLSHEIPLVRLQHMIFHKEVRCCLLKLVIARKFRRVIWNTEYLHELVRALVKPTSLHILGSSQILDPFKSLVNHCNSVLNWGISVTDYLVFNLCQFGLRHE